MLDHLLKICHAPPPDHDDNQYSRRRRLSIQASEITDTRGLLGSTDMT